MNISNTQVSLNTSVGSAVGSKPILISSTPSKSASQTQVTPNNSSPSSNVNHVSSGNFAAVAAANAHTTAIKHPTCKFKFVFQFLKFVLVQSYNTVCKNCSK